MKYIFYLAIVSYSFVAGIAYPATPGDIRSLYTYTNYVGTITGTVSISTIDYIENNDGVLIVRYGKKTVGPGDYPYIMIQGGLYSCAKNKYGYYWRTYYLSQLHYSPSVLSILSLYPQYNKNESCGSQISILDLNNNFALPPCSID